MLTHVLLKFVTLFISQFALNALFLFCNGVTLYFIYLLYIRGIHVHTSS